MIVDQLQDKNQSHKLDLELELECIKRRMIIPKSREIEEEFKMRIKICLNVDTKDNFELKNLEEEIELE